MNKRSLCLLLLIAFFLGCFFQYSRLDGFLHLGLVGNELSAERSERPMPPEGNLPREKFLIVYDPADVASMYARHNTEKLLTENARTMRAAPSTIRVPLTARIRASLWRRGAWTR